MSRIGPFPAKARATFGSSRRSPRPPTARRVIGATAPMAISVTRTTQQARNTTWNEKACRACARWNDCGGDDDQTARGNKTLKIGTPRCAKAATPRPSEASVGRTFIAATSIRCVVQTAPSHHRNEPSPDGSGNQPGGGEAADSELDTTPMVSACDAALEPVRFGPWLPSWLPLDILVSSRSAERGRKPRKH